MKFRRRKLKERWAREQEAIDAANLITLAAIICFFVLIAILIATGVTHVRPPA